MAENEHSDKPSITTSQMNPIPSINITTAPFGKYAVSSNIINTRSYSSAIHFCTGSGELFMVINQNEMYCFRDGQRIETADVDGAWLMGKLREAFLGEKGQG